MSLVVLATVAWFPTKALAQLVPGGGGFGSSGSSGTANPALNTAQTPDTYYFSTDPLGNSLIIAEAADATFDFAHAIATDPLLCIHSHNQTTTEFVCLFNNGSNSVINAGGSNTALLIQSAGSNKHLFGSVEYRAGSALGIGFSANADPNVSANDAFFKRKAAATIQMGADANGAVVAQRIQGPNGITGTDIAGGNISFGGQVGTGAGAGSQSGIDRALMRATSTTAQVNAPAIYACESKTLSNTTATTTALATVALASNSAGAVRITASVTCDDGTNFDSDVVTSYVAFVNKATVITFGTPVTTTSAAANNSGSCTVAPTFTAGSSLINVNVTPVITTIVPTTTTAYLNIETFGAGAVVCK